LKKRVRLHYGESEIELDVRGRSVQLLGVGRVAELQDWQRSLKSELKMRLARFKGGLIKDGRPKKVLLVIDDISRPTPTWLIVPVIVDVLQELGIPNENVGVLVALGSHRQMTADELRKKVGRVAGKVKVFQHDAWDMSAMHDYGEMNVEGIRFKLLAHRALHEYDVKIGVGSVAPHVDAGWSGGGKIVLPGVAHESTVTKFHMSEVFLLKRYKLDYFAGNISGPLRKASDRSARMVGLNLIVNVVLNSEEEIAGVFVGDPIRAHRRAVAFSRTIYAPTFRAPADIVLVSAHPEDIDYWQGMKGEEIAYPVVKKGGTIVLLAACPDGLCPVEEHRRNLALLGLRSFAKVERLLREGKIRHSISVAIALEVAQVREKAETFIVTEGLSERDCSEVGIRRFEGLEEAMEAAYRKHGKSATVAVIESSLVLPVRR